MWFATKSSLTPGPCKRQRQASSNLSWSGWQLRLMMFRSKNSAPTLKTRTVLHISVLTPHSTVDMLGLCKSRGKQVNA